MSIRSFWLLLAAGCLLIWAAIAVTVLWLTAPTPSPVATVCQLEDGSGAGQAYPCVWDGGQRGNRTGTTYTLTGPVNP